MRCLTEETNAQHWPVIVLIPYLSVNWLLFAKIWSPYHYWFWSLLYHLALGLPSVVHQVMLESMVTASTFHRVLGQMFGDLSSMGDEQIYRSVLLINVQLNTVLYCALVLLLSWPPIPSLFVRSKFYCSFTIIWDSKVWDSWGLSLYIILYRGVSCYFDQNLFFVGRTSQPSLVPLLLLSSI